MQKVLNYINKNKGVSAALYVAAIILLQIIVSKYKYGYVLPVIVFLIFIFFLIIARQRKSKALKTRGLTPGDITNIEFVKFWDVTRKTGVVRYCLIEGGLICGIILFIPISLIAFFAIGLDTILSNYRYLLSASSVSLTAGYILGVAIYYFRWQTNERRFKRLTDPLSLLGN